MGMGEGEERSEGGEDVNGEGVVTNFKGNNNFPQ